MKKRYFPAKKHTAIKHLIPISDITFKRVFGEHPDLMISLLNAMLPLAPGRDKWKKGLEEGFEEGFEEGRKAGVEEGLRQGSWKLAAIMKSSGLNPGTIVLATGLSPEDIREL